MGSWPSYFSLRVGILSRFHRQEDPSWIIYLGHNWEVKFSAVGFGVGAETLELAKLAAPPAHEKEFIWVFWGGDP